MTMRRIVRAARRQPALVWGTGFVGALLLGAGVAVWQGGFLVRLIVLACGVMLIDPLLDGVRVWIRAVEREHMLERYERGRHAAPVVLPYWPVDLDVEPDQGDDAA